MNRVSIIVTITAMNIAIIMNKRDRIHLITSIEVIFLSGSDKDFLG
jgi:hypothetical protein